jgi:hypothetical protein
MDMSLIDCTIEDAFKEFERTGEVSNSAEKLINAARILREEISKVDLESVFGDGFYNGFIKAQEINEKEDEILEDYFTEDILSLSEYAESESKYPASELINK